MRLTDPLLFHGAFRERIRALDQQLGREGIPLSLYEGARSPWRQQSLFERTPPVTRARPWQSFHQYGMAADFVFLVGAKWTWSEPEDGMWARYTDLVAECGLDSLSFERPHCQFRIPIADLRAGKFPEGGGEYWKSWLGRQIELWTASGLPGAPPPFDIGERPPLAEGDA
jgi:peptidoglycan L-alanyl-D-glutamate endopeptidase CwlK